MHFFSFCFQFFDKLFPSPKLSLANPIFFFRISIFKSFDLTPNFISHKNTHRILSLISALQCCEKSVLCTESRHTIDAHVKATAFAYISQRKPIPETWRRLSLSTTKFTSPTQLSLHVLFLMKMFRSTDLRRLNEYLGGFGLIWVSVESFYPYTSCPARRCSGIRAPR